MPQSVTLETARFQEVYWDNQGKVNVTNGGKNFQVQFNPQTLKLTYSNQKAGGDQPKGSSTQFVGRGVTKLSLELWFDVALAQTQNKATAKDVRQLTQEVVYFMIPKDAPASSAKKQAPPPPGLQISWGAFTFAGNMDSLDETLDFFSSDGYPLRSSLAISITRQEIQYDATAAATLQNPQSAGLQEYTPVQSKQTFQQMAANAGSSSLPGAPGWQGLALANGIENPRLIAAGALVNVSADVSVSASAQLGVTAQTSGPLSLNLGTSGTASGGVALGFVGTTITSGGSAGFQASAGFSIGS
ncbi:hypothetical protein EDE15_3536 [Edaphobacter aggregans]|uniref:Contractile injection system tube protein N-terminal domain-containing protein n=1 Tax=Edaphobacter aggregans TaxID=570835 RepID=A0A428MML7_9BACT|nr:peptidoglycan-binding protein [Edaphobacter aggregans]RSL17983.1 hypothetical protein EDE15_3536 [Edaphobacter aggregans]